MLTDEQREAIKYVIATLAATPLDSATLHKRVRALKSLLAAHSAGRSLPLSKEQKAALDLAVLNLKTHGDDQLLSAVTPLIEYYKSTAHSAGAQEPVAEVESWTNGSYHRNYKLRWLKDVEVGAKLYSQSQPMPQTDAARDVLAERQRQISEEGAKPEEDDAYKDHELARAAIAYARSGIGLVSDGNVPTQWPWMTNWWKPSTPRRDLVKAAALILAEIERLDRAKGE